jgi:hypothetical protein
MKISKRMRHLHRGASIAFSLAVVANFAVMPLGDEEIGMTVGGLTLIPLIALMITGLYLFALPYRRKATGADVSRAFP